MQRRNRNPVARKPRNQRTRRNYGSGNKAKDLIVVPRSFGFAPPRVQCTLRYSVTGTINNVGNTTCSARYRPTNAFDVDPLVASTAMPGFAEWALLYRRYRTHSSRIKVEFMNAEAFPMVVAIIPTTTDPGSNQSGSTTIALLAQPVCRSAPIGAITGNAIRSITHTMATSVIGGVSDDNTADDYSSSVLAGPLLNWYWDVFTNSGSNILANGILVHVSVDVNIEFFSLNSPLA